MSMTNKEIYDYAKKHGIKDICKFMKDMRRAGLKIRYYQGRFNWSGPAVVVPDIQDALSNTRVKCQWDNMALEYVVYPKAQLKLW